MLSIFTKHIQQALPLEFIFRQFPHCLTNDVPLSSYLPTFQSNPTCACCCLCIVVGGTHVYASGIKCSFRQLRSYKQQIIQHSSFAKWNKKTKMDLLCSKVAAVVVCHSQSANPPCPLKQHTYLPATNVSTPSMYVRFVIIIICCGA